MKKTLQLTHIHQYEKEFQKTLDIGKKQKTNCLGKISKDTLAEVEPESEFKFVTGNIFMSSLLTRFELFKVTTTLLIFLIL